MKKMIMIVFTLLFMVLILPINATGQDVASEEINDSEELRLSLERLQQDPGSKEVKFIIRVKSEIDSQRGKVSWNINGVSKFKNPSDAVVNTTFKKGEVKAFEIIVVPTQEGVNNIEVIVEATEAEGVLAVNARQTFGTNVEKDVLPITDEYQSAKNLYFIWLIIRNVSIAVISILLVVFSAFKFIKWLNKDDRKV